MRFEDSAARKLFGEITRRQSPLATDKEGRFRIEGVISHMGFALGFRQGREVMVQDMRPVQYQVKAGETLNLGEFRVKLFKPTRLIGP